jgi:L-aspartate oxidase
MRYFLSFDTRLLPTEDREVVVCGSGIAGLTTAIVLKELGIEPLLLTRGLGNTYYSQGGIAAPVHPSDSPYVHFLDTIKAGRYINDEEKLRILVEDALLRITDLERWGVRFDKDEQGNYQLTLEGGHSFKRVLKVKDYTGRAIYQALLNRARELSIEILEGELQEILGEERVQGILVETGNTLRVFRVKALVLATGGAASMFKYTSNPEKVRGDGIGMAFRGGATLKNTEFVQFHPTVLRGTGFLISEAVRGEGAMLINSEGERFVEELKPRDEVSRAIFNQILQGKEVFLDLRPITEGGRDISKLFPTIHSVLREKGIDASRELVPVNPAAHYYIGGLEVDSVGRTSLGGLYAVGECSCTGVHGANRLASNSLLEGVVFGYRAGYGVYSDLKYLSFSDLGIKNRPKGGSRKPSTTYSELKELMWRYAGIKRSKEGLEIAKDKIEQWLKESSAWERTPSNRKLLDILLVSYATVISALRRKESRGAHYREDYPYERDVYRKESEIRPEILQSI